MNTKTFIDSIKSQKFDQIVKAAKTIKDSKGVSEEVSSLLQLIANNDTSVSQVEKSLAEMNLQA